MNAPDPFAAAVADKLPMIDPADFPHRFLVLRENAKPESAVAFVWMPTPWPEDVLGNVIGTLANGGGLVLMAADPVELVRMREVVELLIAPGGSA